MAIQEHCTVEHLANVFAGAKDEIIAEWRTQASELLRELNLDKLTLTDHLPDVIAEITRDLALGRAGTLLVDGLKERLDEETAAETSEAFEIIRRNLGRVEDLITRVLNAKAQPAGLGSSFRPELRTFELWPLVQRLILDLRSVWSKHDIEVVNQIPRALTVCADAGLISQVFQNLLGNAFKYAARGRVVVSAQDNGDSVSCVVHDNGAGIP